MYWTQFSGKELSALHDAENYKERMMHVADTHTNEYAEAMQIAQEENLFEPSFASLGMTWTDFL